MADRVLDGVPGSSIPEIDGSLRGPRTDQEPTTLAWRLTGVVDKLRGLNARFGIRPYRVFLCHVVWTGPKRGVGEQRVERREILPVPRVRDMDSIRNVLRSTGNGEEGDLVIDEISARIPEDDLVGNTPDLQDLVVARTARVATEFYWEVEENRPSNPRPKKRRFAPASAPTLDRAGVSWRIVLTKQDYDRGRQGGTARTDF